MDLTIRKELMNLADKNYAHFKEKLIPGYSKEILGVRQPVLRKMAKDLIRKHDYHHYLKDHDEKYMEEVMLKGMIIGYGTAKEGDIKEALQLMDEFSDEVDNWAICDSFASSFTIVEDYKDEVFKHLKLYLESGREYLVRLALVIFLDYYVKLDEHGKKIKRKSRVDMTDLEDVNERVNPWLEKLFRVIDRDMGEDYYTQLALGWFLSEAFNAYPREVFLFLSDRKKRNLTDKSYNNAIKKIRESKVPTKDVKDYIVEKLRIK